MPDTKHRRKKTTCPNCGTSLTAKANYCPTCGQENHDLKIPLGHLMYEFVEGIFHFDPKFWKTTKAIFTRPGKITRDFIEGCRARYVPPVRLYIFVSFVFFLLVSVLSERGLEAVNEATSSPSEVRKALTGELTRYTRTTDSLLAGRVAALPEQRRDELFDSLDARREREQKLKLLYPVADWQVYLERQLADQLRKSVQAGNADDSKLSFRTKVPHSDLLKIKNFSNAQVDSVLGANGEKPGWISRGMIRQAARFVAKENGRETVREQSRELIHKLVKNTSVMMFVLMPVVAFLLMGIYYRRKRFYYEHLIFSVHLHAVAFLIFSMVFVVWLGTH